MAIKYWKTWSGPVNVVYEIETFFTEPSKAFWKTTPKGAPTFEIISKRESVCGGLRDCTAIGARTRDTNGWSRDLLDRTSQTLRPKNRFTAQIYGFPPF
jgi:hypothetical protein